MGAIMTVATLNMVRINRRYRESLQLQLYKRIRHAIISGELTAGVRLPSTRDLVEQLHLSRNTIVNALDRLMAEGYVESRVGSGIYVAHLPAVNKPAKTKAANSRSVSDARLRISNRVVSLTKVRVSPEYPTSKVRPFRPCQPAIDQFPLRSWNRARSYALRSQPNELMREGEQAGARRLRKALAAYLRDARGVSCEAEQIVITAGAQQALSLICSILVEGGDAVWIEDPGYLGARAAFIRAAAALVPIPIDAEGLTIPDVRQTPRLVYCTPSRQFPLGTTMTLVRRLALLEFARRSDSWIIEDDYDSEFRYIGRPLPSLQGLDHTGRVIYVGSFSKVLFPSLRLGYIVAPPSLVDSIRKMKAIESGCSPGMDQATTAIFLEEGYFSAHMRRIRKLYRERRDSFCLEAKKYVSGLLSFPSIDAGMDVVGWLTEGDDRTLSKQLGALGIDAPPLSAYALRPCASGLLFGFTGFSPNQIQAAMQCVSRVTVPQL